MYWAPRKRASEKVLHKLPQHLPGAAPLLVCTYFHAANFLCMKKIAALLTTTLIATGSMAQVYRQTNPLAHTYSIVARDSVTGEMGVAVQSHWFSVGTAVSWGENGVGVVATQSFVDKRYGHEGLRLMKQGLSAPAALAQLLQADAAGAVRQVAMIDAQGRVAAHTGSNCIDYASHITGPNFSVQSNMMLKPTVCEAMAAAFRSSYGKPLAERLLAALQAAQAQGGDIRGQQSAALLVVSGDNSLAPWYGRLTDLRVDDHPHPLQELQRLLKVHQAYNLMNDGDLAIEKGELDKAMQAYQAAMRLFPANLEMQYWTAIGLANNQQITKAAAMLQRIYKQDANWRELTRRLPKVGLLTLPANDLKKLL